MIIQIVVFLKWIRRVLEIKMYLGRVLDLLEETYEILGFESSEQLVFFSYNWAKDLKLAKTFLPEITLW